MPYKRLRKFVSSRLESNQFYIELGRMKAEEGQDDYLSAPADELLRLAQAASYHSDLDGEIIDCLFLLAIDNGISEDNAEEGDWRTHTSRSINGYRIELVSWGELDEARELLESALDDLPAGWWPNLTSEYLRLIDQAEVSSFVPEEIPRGVNTWTLMDQSQSKAERGEFGIAKKLALAAVRAARLQNNQLDVWRAEGQYGRVLHLAGQPEAAVEIWWRVFRAGSDNRVTADCLTRHLESQGRIKECVEVLEELFARRKEDDWWIRRHLKELRTRLRRYQAQLKGREE